MSAGYAFASRRWERSMFGWCVQWIGLKRPLDGRGMRLRHWYDVRPPKHGCSPAKLLEAFARIGLSRPTANPWTRPSQQSPNVGLELIQGWSQEANQIVQQAWVLNSSAQSSEVAGTSQPEGGELGPSCLSVTEPLYIVLWKITLDRLQNSLVVNGQHPTPLARV